MTDADIQALLRALAEQQTALLAAHAESMRVQRALIDRLGTAGPALVADQTERVEVASASSTTRDQPLTSAGTHVEDLDPLEPPAGDTVETRSTELEVQPLASQLQVAADPDDRPSLRVVGGTAGARSDRYYRSAPRAQPGPAPVSASDLSTLRAVRGMGEVGHLLLMFGPHAGETLGQVALKDVEYVRELARTAQRADVRAAAARLIAAVPSEPPEHRRPGTPKVRRRG